MAKLQNEYQDDLRFLKAFYEWKGKVSSGEGGQMQSETVADANVLTVVSEAGSEGIVEDAVDECVSEGASGGLLLQGVLGGVVDVVVEDVTEGVSGGSPEGVSVMNRTALGPDLALACEELHG